jgi:glc operon protein GlcG
MRVRIVAPAAAALALVAAGAQAQAYGPAVQLDAARKVAAAAQAEARRTRDAVAVAVVEPSGQLILFERMDGTIYAATALAEAKARSAAAFRQPTANFQGAVKDAPYVLGAIGAVTVEGGVPLVVDGRVVGAVGVSGSSPEDDGRIARAGAAALSGAARPAG